MATWLENGAPLVIGSHYSGVRLTTTSVSAWVKACGFDPKKGALTTESKSWAVDPKTGVKKALTSNGEWFDTFEFGSKNGIIQRMATTSLWPLPRQSHCRIGSCEGES